MAFIEKLPKEARQNLPIITRQSPSFAAWREYFERYIGYVPIPFAQMIEGLREHVTMPAEFPMWLDDTFIEDPNWRPKQRPKASLQMRQSLEQLWGRYGRTWGLKRMEDPKRKRPWVAPTDDELRAYYAHQATSEAAE